MTPNGLLNWPTLLSAGLACFVEMVEALTIVLAVATVCGWRTAWAGAIAALLVLAAIVALFGPLLRHLDLRPLQIVVGALLLLFGMRWLRKAILRAAGRIPLHDEAAAFAHEVGALSAKGEQRRYGIDMLAAATSFNGVLVEGIEVVFIVVAVGSTSQRLDSAIAGAAVALAAVVALGLLLRRPLSAIPENTLKMLVGVMLMSLGTLWAGEGIGLTWPFGDWAVLAIAGIFLLTALVMVRLFARAPELSLTQPPAP